jgi:hypothetical protein
MKILDPYQRRIAKYEGIITFHKSDDSPKTGYFEAIQTQDGSLALGCLIPDFLLPVPNLEEVQITAVDVEGWNITFEGSKHYKLLKPRMTPNALMTTILISPGCLKARRYTDRDLRYQCSRFYVTNLVFTPNTDHTPESIILGVEGRSIEIKPMPNYVDNIRLIQAIPGIELTTIVEIHALTDQRHSLDEDADFMNNFINVLQLWSGNKLDWVYGEALDDNCTNVIEVIHKDAITGEFSNIFISQRWNLPFTDFATSYFSNDGFLSSDESRKFVSYFIDCCSTRPYLEIRALSTATLLDTLTLKYALHMHNDEIIDKKLFESIVLPELKKKIDGIPLADKKRLPLKNNLVGIYRSSFRQRLKSINAYYNLRLSSDVLGKIVNVRNDLVHKGVLQGKTGKDKFKNYRLLLWTDFSILCRLLGYQGALNDNS